MKNTLRFLKKLTPMLALAAMMLAPNLGWGQVQTYQLITSDSQLEAGAKYLVVGIKATPTPETFYAMGLQNTNNRASVSITVASGEIVVEPATLPTDEMPFEVTLGGSSGVWTIFDAVNSTYLRPRTGGSNGLQGQPTSTNANWSIAIGAGGLASMVCENTTTYPRNVLRFNASNNPPLFACYASGQADVYLYRLTPSSSSSIFLSPTDLSGFNYVQGSGPSAEQNFTVSGSDLEADISIAASTNYEISKASGSGYTTPLIFTPAEVATPQTVYVRLKAGLSVGDYDNEVITASSTGATDKTVTVSGNVTAPPPPDAPVAAAATAVTATGFTANWDAVAGATGYFLDVYHAGGSSVATDLIISEYIEGTSNEKYIEVFNGTGSSVDLSNYKLQLYANGSSTATNDVTLSGTLVNGSVIVYKNSSANLYPAGITNASVNFNGDDAVALYKISTSSFVDIFGRIGEDPGTEWGSSQLWTINTTLVRKSSITGGVTTNPGSGFPTLSTEWDNYATDVITYLGSHTMGSGAVYDLNNESVSNVTSYAVTSLSPGTTYFYVVRAANANGTSANSNEIEVTTGAVKTSAADGDWNSIAWSPAGTPTAADDVTIYHAVTLNATADCHDLTINAGKSLSVASGGSIITTGTVTGNVTVQRFLTKYDAVGDQMFHFISSPVAAQAIRPEFVSNATTIPAGTDFYSFNEVTNEWINTRATGDVWNTNFETNFTVGKGYMVAYPTDVTKNFTGTLNASAAVLNCTNTLDKGNGWNLLGNPFPSAIDWTQVILGNGMDNALYYYDSGAEKYRYYIQLPGESGALGSGQQYIPAMQGFMVHAKTNGTQTVTLPLAARTHSGQDVFYKSTNAVPGSLSLLVSANGYEDEAFIHFNQHATTAFDGNYDAFKLRSYSDKVPMIYTKGSEGSELAINGLPEVDGETVIPVYFEAATEGTHTITAKLDGLPDAVVYLEDIKLNKTQNLTANPVYSFTASNGDDDNRFRLSFGAVGINNPDATDGVHVYAYDGMLYLETQSNEAAQFKLYNLTGQLVMEGRTGGNALSSFNVSALGTGVYVVNVILNQGVASQKVVIRK
ncbi:MAG: lamin tail domain-containing protein [Bacteroidales bacterium]|jgi:hypothetical protein|nr:lamin tail domain-containing protein [Bacteroidales bacterium]